MKLLVKILRVLDEGILATCEGIDRLVSKGRAVFQTFTREKPMR